MALAICDEEYGDEVILFCLVDKETIGSLWHPSECLVEYGEILLLRPFNNVFSGIGGGVLDGEDEDWRYKGGKGEDVGDDKPFVLWCREEVELESPFSRTFSRW